MTSQLSQPSSSISARDMGSTGAMPKRSAQYLRRLNRVAGTSSGETGTNPVEPEAVMTGRVIARGHRPRALPPRFCGILLRMGGLEQRQFPRLGLGVPVTLLRTGKPPL